MYKFLTLLYIPNTMEAKRATLQSMGLRREKAVAKHILQENVWESNLIPDIAGIDYFAGHQGRTNLQPLDGLPVFADDFFVYGPLREDQIVRIHRRKASCTTGEDCSVKRLISYISLFFREVWGDEDKFKNVAITHTVDAKSRSSRIVAMVEKIEKETGYRAESRTAKAAKAHPWFRNPRSSLSSLHHPFLPIRRKLFSPFFFLHGRSKRHRLISIFKWDGSKTGHMLYWRNECPLLTAARVQQEGKKLSANFYDLYDVEPVSGNSEFSELFDNLIESCIFQHPQREIFPSWNVAKKLFAGG